VSDIFYATITPYRSSLPAGPGFPKVVSVDYQDAPGKLYPIQVINSLTKQPNFLRG